MGRNCGVFERDENGIRQFKGKPEGKRSIRKT
jgi:hypothetical protein